MEIGFVLLLRAVNVVGRWQVTIVPLPFFSVLISTSQYKCEGAWSSVLKELESRILALEF